MLNCIIIQGRLGKDPELRYTQSNTPVTGLTLAVRRGRKNQNGEYLTDWIDCTAWGKTAEFARQWFSKGDMAIVRGRLESRDWEDKQGNKRRSWEVQVESMDFCGSNPDASSTRPHVDNDGFAELTDDSDVPF